MNNILTESVAAAPVKKGSRWLINVAVPGKGNSGNYSEDVLREFGPSAYPPRTKAYFGHALPQDRDPRDQLGSYPEGAFWNEEEQVLQAELKPYARWEPVLEEMKEELEVSMYALDWEKDEADNITRIGYHRGNTIDAVAFGGLVGSGVKGKLFESLVETARAGFDAKPGTTSVSSGKEKMELEEKVDKLFTLVESFISASQQKAEKELQTKVDTEVINSAVNEALASYDGKRALIEAAEVSDTQREALYESAKAGADIAPLIERETKVFTEIRDAASESLQVNGRDFGTAKVESALDYGKVF